MKVRRRTRSAVRAVLLEDPARLVTLEDPAAGVEEARGAFVRLRPPEGTTPDEVEAWRARAAAVALAVKVLPAPRAADVPAASTRVDVEDRVGTVREEALRLAEETGREPVVSLVRVIADEVGA